MLKILIMIGMLFSSLTSFAYIDFNISYTHAKRRVVGVKNDLNPDAGEANTTSDGYGVNLAWYIWDKTALELNYSRTREMLKDDRRVATSDGSIVIENVESEVITEVAGVGLKQAFASKKSAIIPSISLGYAQYSTSGESKFILSQAGVESEITQDNEKQISASSYAAASVRLRLTRLAGITFSAKTIMPDFDTSVAGDNVTYSAGLSWIF